ncbi:MAG: LCP family protein [Chloroflexota bacterium]|jgi:LCP family protein required for cell wall assembly
MTPDDPAQTQQHMDAVPSPDAAGVPPYPPKATPTAGHWYSYPGQPAAMPSPEPLSTPLYGRGRRGKSARDRVQRRKVRRELGAPDDWAWVIIAAALLGMTVIMSMVAFFLLQATRGTQGTVATSAPPLEPTSVLYGPGGVLAASGDAPVGGMLGDGQSMIIRPWDGKERFTVLVMGMDWRPGEFGASVRTDTMILISLDPRANSVGIMSIPRDLYVDVPGYGPQRINTAYSAGELEGPGGGPRLAMQTVQYNFGIRVNEYVLVNFDTFTRVIDLIGGINIEVAQDIYDPLYPDMNYGYDPFYIEAGWHQMDGTTALKYARSRHASDDIDRNRRQQQVIYAIRDKVTAYNMIPELAVQAPALWSELREGIDTGLSLDQILQLAWWVKDIPSTNYRNAVLGWEYVIPTNWQGQDILVPNRAKLGPLMAEVFGADYNQ